ncbi:hypothetical protein MPNT_60121 [Candidatus Methylacidithermus pantelleriae]|uniref:Uncharacterized protein n=1 Tax=Candidatus Methylacidithermus pantelleriae TaxID=2744239 RepID=A0A8J2BW53_9BACT|nr:hypothetical protein MPNT_60121 [Candidatus Methylacidithermus pantelleriae]
MVRETRLLPRAFFGIVEGDWGLFLREWLALSAPKKYSSWVEGKLSFDCRGIYGTIVESKWTRRSGCGRDCD